MICYYTARGTFDKDYNGDVMSWEKYIQWSKLSHLTELVSVDGMLNECLVEPNRDNEDTWDHMVIAENLYETGFYKTLDYVLQHMEKRARFNLLAVVIEPEQECKNVSLDNFDFVGYDLLDKDYSISALSNCGGFEETFSPADLNNFGLIDKYENAYDIKRRLLENNPEEHHADTNVIAIWRHKTIGRKKTNHEKPNR